MTFAVERLVGSAADLHGRPMPDPVTRAVWELRVERPALVLGSTQPDTVVDRARAESAGVDVVRRNSGGGAVLLVPGEHLWIDVLLPRGDPRWDDDVGAASWWLGDVWAAALDATGILGATVHRGPLQRGDWGGVVCFGGLGPGEVIVGDRKIVGVAQRRTRAGARFQCVVLAVWNPEPLARLVGLDDRATAALVTAGTGVGARLPDLGAAVLTSLGSAM